MGVNKARILVHIAVQVAAAKCSLGFHRGGCAFHNVHAWLPLPTNQSYGHTLKIPKWDDELFLHLEKILWGGFYTATFFIRLWALCLSMQKLVEVAKGTWMGKSKQAIDWLTLEAPALRDCHEAKERTNYLWSSTSTLDPWSCPAADNQELGLLAASLSHTFEIKV